MIASLFRRRHDPFLYPGEEIVRADVPRMRLNGMRKRALETGRTRLIVTGGLFLLAFTVIAGRLVEITSFSGVEAAPRSGAVAARAGRGDILDRNGVVLATSLPTVNLYADAREIPDAKGVTNKLAGVLTDIDKTDFLQKLGSERSFIYLKRNLTPNQQYEVNRLGIPGLYFERGERRVYPHGNLAAHAIGMTDIDGHGVSGLEKSFDEHLSASDKPLRLSIDMRVQHILREELTSTIEEFDAIGATGIVMDVTTGELIATASLPDFNPNNPPSPGNASAREPDATFNRATLGVYEMGSTFKLFTAAAALDAGITTLERRYDATNPIQIARFSITDYHAQKRWLSVPEILIHSSNIGAARMAVDLGTTGFKGFLNKLGMFDRPAIELSETGMPLAPQPWRDISTMTVSYGHGLAVTPMHMATAVGALVNGGVLHKATLLKHEGDQPASGKKVLSAETSRKMRGLMRQVVSEGTGSKADVPGYFVGGKTGTAEKNVNGHYVRKALLSSFVSAFPMTSPRYAVIVIVDEPHGTKSSFGYATAGWTAAPTAGRIVARMAPLVGIAPVHSEGSEKRSSMAVPAMVSGGDGEAE